jgi:hypothetical protein
MEHGAKFRLTPPAIHLSARERERERERERKM